MEESIQKPGRGGAGRAMSRVFPLRTFLSGLAGFLVGLLFLNYFLRDPSPEMPALAAPGPSMPAFQGLSPKRRPDEIRIFVVGASLTSGYPYQPSGAASYASLLEKGLASLFPGRTVTCRPAAIPALDSPRLAEIVREALRHDPSLVCVALGSNEYANRIFFGRPLVPARIREIAEDRISRARLLFKALWRLLPGGKVKASRQVQRRIAGKILEARPGKPGLAGLPVGKADRRLLLGRLGRAMEEMSRACAEKKVPLVFLAAAHNLAGSWPWSDLGRKGAKAADRLVGLYRRGETRGLLPRVQSALKKYPDRADLAFLEGLLLEKKGKNREARDAFEKARDADAVPMHRTGPILRRIRESARRLGRPFLDLNLPLAAGRAGGIPGPGLFLDYGHLDLEGHEILALFLARRLSSLKLLPPLPPGWETRFRKKVRAYLDQTITPASLRGARPNLSWANGNFFMLFGNFRDALPLLERAFREGATGSPAADLPFTFNLLFCAYTLAGKESEVVGIPEKERNARFRALYTRMLRARREGRLGEVLGEILDGKG